MRPRTSAKELLLAILLCVDFALAATFPAGFVEEDIVSGLNQPVAMAWLPDGRFLVAERAGVVKMVDPEVASVTATVLDISDDVNNTNNRGLLGLAVDPEFPSSPWIYLLYSHDPPEAADPSPFWDGEASPTRELANGARDGRGHRVSRLDRARLDVDEGFEAVVPGSRTTILGSQSTWANLGDPFSYQSDLSRPWSCASYEEGEANNEGTPIDDCIASDGVSHSIGTLRFASDGSLFVGMGDASHFAFHQADERSLRALDLSWLSGKILRIDPSTGRGLPSNPFYQGDGSSNRSRVWAYGLRNPFRFAIDPSSDTPWVGDVGSARYEELNLAVAGAGYGWPCFEGGLSDEDLAASEAIGAGSSRRHPTWEEHPDCLALARPTAPELTWCHSEVHSGCAEGSHSALTAVVYDRGAYPARYRGVWFGDTLAGWLESYDPLGEERTPISTDLVTVVDASIGPDDEVYLVDLALGSITRVHYLGGENVQPVAEILSPAGDLTTEIGSLITLAGTGSDAEDGTLDGDSLVWSVRIHLESHIEPGTYAATGSNPPPLTLEDHGDQGSLEICLEAFDSEGLSDVDCVAVLPTRVSYRFETDPPGLEVSYDGLRSRTPFTVQSPVGALRSIEAPSPQQGRVFESWNIGPEATQLITIDSTDQTLIATFQCPIIHLENRSIDGSELHQTCGSIELGPGLEISDSAVLQLEAGTAIRISSGVAFRSGAEARLSLANPGS